MSLYRILAYHKSKLIERRNDLSWPAACGIIGNAGEGNIDEAYVFRQRSSEEPLSIEPIVLKYSKKGMA